MTHRSTRAAKPAAPVAPRAAAATTRRSPDAEDPSQPSTAAEDTAAPPRRRAAPSAATPPTEAGSPAADAPALPSVEGVPAVQPSVAPPLRTTQARPLQRQALRAVRFRPSRHLLLGAGGLLLCLLCGWYAMVRRPDPPNQWLAAAGAVRSGTPAAPATVAAHAVPPGAATPSGGATTPADLSAFSEADLLPTGVPITRQDWVITKDYAAHGGNDPVAREKWGAVDFAFWHNKDAFGAAVVATHAGKVKLLKDDPTYGNLVYVQGPHYTTTYGHLQKFTVQEGQTVRRGDQVGEMGSTGSSTGPHVDYQVWMNNRNQNPLNYCQCSMQGSAVPTPAPR